MITVLSQIVLHAVRQVASLPVDKNVETAMRGQLDEVSSARRRYRSILAPIRHLPQEVLLSIFSLCCESYFGEDTLDFEKFPWFLSHICHMWRDLVPSSLLR
ncbi:hypothetical protein IW262DRAFT_1386283 [Armillaria fumosa]|nr:hypothetical protein IW262DRAFT_1386283 [Armillaria fumosa]